MRQGFAKTGLLSMLLAGITATQPAFAQNAQWVPLWTAAPQPLWDNAKAIFGTGLPDRIAGTTIEQPLTLAMSAQHVRIEFSNRYGDRPLEIAEGSVRCLDAGTDQVLSRLTFDNAIRASAPAGGRVISDPLAVAGCRRLAVSIRFFSANGGDFHWDARETSRYETADGAQGTMTARLALSAVYGDVRVKGVVVALGDSITDGNGAPIDAMVRWPDDLARNLAPHDIAVVNGGISGNRLLRDGMGKALIERLATDAFALPRVDTVVLLIGTNDIAWPGTPFAADEPAMTLDAMKAGFRSAIAQADLQGVRMIVATIAPFNGALPGTPMHDTYWTPEKDRLRRAFNDWLRSEHGSAELFDLDRLVADPANPLRLLPAYDSGDRLHPGAIGNRAIADALTTIIQSGE